jgi:hypothetical protein
MRWYRTSPRHGVPAVIAHAFDRGARQPLCVRDTQAPDPGGTITLLADELSPRCMACVALMGCPRAVA